MKKLLQIVAGILRFFNNPIYRFWFQHSQSHVSFTGQRCSPLLRALGRRYFAASTEEYAKRNYASNVSEYTTVVSSLTAQRRSFANLIVLWRNLMGFVSFFLSRALFLRDLLGFVVVVVIGIFCWEMRMMIWCLMGFSHLETFFIRWSLGPWKELGCRIPSSS